MQKTSLVQKIFLFLVSILLTLLILEGGLRLAGALYTLKQDSQNVVALSGDEIRILCIGESTTAMGSENSYPSQLENILNQKGFAKKFKVINKGRISDTSEGILNVLDKNLKKYRPSIVVGMIGVNDYILEERQKKLIKLPKIITGMRVYKLFALLGRHLRHKIGLEKNSPVLDQTQNNSADAGIADAIGDDANASSFRESIETLTVQYQDIQQQKQRAATKEDQEALKAAENKVDYALGLLYRRMGEYEKAERHLLSALDGESNLERVYIELGLIMKEKKDYKKAAEFFEKSLQTVTTKRGMMEMARIKDLIGDKGGAAKLFLIVVASQPESARTYAEIGRWFEDQKLYPQAEIVYLTGIKEKPNDYILSDAAANLYQRFNQKDRAEKYFSRSEKIKKRIFREMSITAENYNKIYDMVRSKGDIQFIAMQYPLRSVEPLKGYFADKDEIIFVENKNNFEKALKRADYNDYFTDNFAYDFGHCTRKGNHLIAENLSNVIADYLKKKGEI